MGNYKILDKVLGKEIDLKKWKVTFVEKKKYNSMTRSVIIESMNEQTAVDMVLREFGGIKEISVTSVTNAKENELD